MKMLTEAELNACQNGDTFYVTQGQESWIMIKWKDYYYPYILRTTKGYWHQAFEGIHREDSRFLFHIPSLEVEDKVLRALKEIPGSSCPFLKSNYTAYKVLKRRLILSLC